MNEQPKDYVVNDYPVSMAKRLRDLCLANNHNEYYTIEIDASELLDILTDYLQRVEK